MTTQTPPSLEVVSDPSKESVKERDKGLERRKLPRLNFSGEQFRLNQNGKIFAAVDISPRGMALRIIDPEDFRIFSVGARLEGQLNIGRGKHPLTAQVRNIRPDTVGCEFENLTPETETALKTFLDPVFLGQELRPIPSSGQSTLWYHGPSGTDLLLWRATDGQYRRLTLYVQGTYIQWESDLGITTGRSISAQERSEMHGIFRFETIILHPDAVADAGKLSIAKSVLLSSNLPQDLKKWCVRQLER